MSKECAATIIRGGTAAASMLAPCGKLGKNHLRRGQGYERTPAAFERTRRSNASSVGPWERLRPATPRARGPR